MWVQRQAVDDAKKNLKLAQENLEEQEFRILNYLEATSSDRFDAPSCTVFRREKTSVKTPKTEEQKAAFFNYLKEKGLFDSMITVNSQTLNGWYKSEQEVARSKGQFEFSIPGLEEPTIYYDLNVRGK